MRGGEPQRLPRYVFFSPFAPGAEGKTIRTEAFLCHVGSGLTTQRQKRLEAAKPKGKLGAQLEAQQKMSRVETLKDASHQALQQRELDAQAQNLRHD
jgi:hypothetical protein